MVAQIGTTFCREPAVRVGTPFNSGAFHDLPLRTAIESECNVPSYSRLWRKVAVSSRGLPDAAARDTVQCAGSRDISDESPPMDDSGVLLACVHPTSGEIWESVSVRETQERLRGIDGGCDLVSLNLAYNRNILQTTM